MTTLNTSKKPNNQKPHRTNESERRQASDRPEDNTHVYCALRGIRRGAGQSLKTGSAENDSGKTQITEHPNEHDSRSEALVVILLVFGG